MRLTTRTNLAMRTLMFCAINNDGLVRKTDIAQACNASENHLALVINRLAQAGFLHTTRGRHGGVQLGHEPQQISVGDVFRTLESDVPFAECFDSRGNACPITPGCRLRAALATAVEAFYASLDPLTLADLTENNCVLEGLLRLAEDGPAAQRMNGICRLAGSRETGETALPGAA